MIGLDAALVEGASSTKDVQVREVTGGCICCSASFMFDVSLVLLLQKRPDRLLIEPTGLATLSGILDTLRRPGIHEAVDIRSVVCLLDPMNLSKDLQREEVEDQIDAADVLLANRADLAEPQHLAAFESWAQTIFPAKDFVGRISQGRIPLEYLDIVADRESSQARGRSVDGHHHLHAHGHAHEEKSTPPEDSCSASNPVVRRDHQSGTAASVGWVCWHELVFDAKPISDWLTALAQRSNISRVKAVLHTNEGWWSFNLARGTEETRPTGYRRDSRVELVIDGEPTPDIAALENTLRECVLPPSDKKTERQPPRSIEN
ncbi:MAG: GTP-binding protein [Myxococcota bacterium]